MIAFSSGFRLDLMSTLLYVFVCVMQTVNVKQVSNFNAVHVVAMQDGRNHVSRARG